MHGLDERRDMLRRRGRDDPMPEVEDVAGRRARRIDDRVGFALDGLGIGEKHERVEVPLQRPAWTDPRCRVVQRHPEVNAHHVRPGLTHRVQQLTDEAAEFQHFKTDDGLRPLVLIG